MIIAIADKDVLATASVTSLIEAVQILVIVKENASNVIVLLVALATVVVQEQIVDVIVIVNAKENVLNKNKKNKVKQ